MGLMRAHRDVDILYLCLTPAPPSPAPRLPQCEGCLAQVTHLCPADKTPDKEAGDTQACESDVAGIAIQIPGLEPYHVPGLEPYHIAESTDESQSLRAEDIPELLGPNDPQATNPQEVDYLFFDWEDFSDAIQAIPNGASCGPDGIPAVMLKQARIPISRLMCQLFKSSLKTGEIPKILKLAFITPIHKGGSRAETVNFRPISLTSHIMKTFERVMRRTLVNFLELNLKVDPKQHGSRSGRSTLSQLLQHHDEILAALENGDNIDSIYLDFSKAYDKVDHGILLHKLKALGITGKLGKWILSFLTGRYQVILVDGRKSKLTLLISGVPQGSVLGPLLFLIFIGDIGEGVTAKVLIYVDDSKVKDVVTNEEDVEKLQANLDKIYKWEERNNMKFNGGKFQIVRYGANQELKDNSLYFTGEMAEVIEQVSTVKDLGITLTDDAKFEEHIEKVAKKSRQKCGWLLRSFYSRNENFLKHMFKTLVQPHIDYCSQLWSPPEGQHLDKIEGVLRNFSRKIPTMKHLNYWQRLAKLKMNSEERRLERYKIIYTWKCLEGLVPDCGIKELKTVNQGRNEHKGRLCSIPEKKSKLKSIQTMREASFQVIGPKLFNTLPKVIRDMTKCGPDEFKMELDKFLTFVPDEPKCQGLTPVAQNPVTAQASNSLLHQVNWARREGLLKGMTF